MEKDGQVIFVKTDYVEDFARRVVPRLKKKFILITHNSDYGVPRGKTTKSVIVHPRDL